MRKCKLLFDSNTFIYSIMCVFNFYIFPILFHYKVFMCMYSYIYLMFNVLFMRSCITRCRMGRSVAEKGGRRVERREKYFVLR